MPVVHVRVDRNAPLAREPGTGHNRWHPDIAPVATCAPGDTVVLDTRDAADGQITAASTVSDLSQFDIHRVHPLTGPVWVEGAHPGDLLELEVEHLEAGPFGFTAVTPGFGFLRDIFVDPFLVRWRLSGGPGGVAVSDDLPGVAIPAAPFLGVVGVAPDHDLMRLARQREEDAVARGEFAAPPTAPTSSVPAGTAFRHALRTGPPRENGGNLDIPQLGVGTRIQLPVFVEGALFSVGDAHFAQGDGEVCGLAIETTATVRLHVRLLPGEARRGRVSQTRFTFHSREAARPYFVTTGLSIANDTVSLSENTTVAARNALLSMIDYLTGRGFSREQAYVLCSVAVDLRISQVVDVPHATVCAVLPLDIFT